MKGHCDPEIKVEEMSSKAGRAAPIRAPPRRRKEPAEAPVFLQKTYQMISQCPPAVAGWNPDGLTFVVKSPEAFADLLPRYFKHRNFRSFVRQLNFYGFRKLRADGALISDRPTTWWEFRHDKFQRGKPQLLAQIRRATHYETDGAPGASSESVDDLRSEVSVLRSRIDDLTETLDSLTGLVDQLVRERTDGGALPPVKKRKLLEGGLVGLLAPKREFADDDDDDDIADDMSMTREPLDDDDADSSLDAADGAAERGPCEGGALVKTESLELLESMLADAGATVSSPCSDARAACAASPRATSPRAARDDMESDDLAAPFAKGLSLDSSLGDDFDASVDSLLDNMATGDDTANEAADMPPATDDTPPTAGAPPATDDAQPTDGAMPAAPTAPLAAPATSAALAAAPQPASPAAAPPAMLAGSALRNAAGIGASAALVSTPEFAAAAAAAALSTVASCASANIAAGMRGGTLAAAAAPTPAAAPSAPGASAGSPISQSAPPAIALPLASAALGAFFTKLSATQQQQLLAAAAGVPLPPPPTHTGPAASRA